MKGTTNIQAIVLRRLKYRENDSRLSVYSPEKGLIDLVARGTAKPKSKLAAHIEPLNLVNIMIITGKNFDYAGSVISEKCFSGIKNDFARVEIVGQAIFIFNKLVREGEADKNLFFLLTDFLSIIDSGLIKEKKLEFFKHIFIFKLLSQLGHGAELGECVFCKTKLKEEKNIFDFHRGGVLCCHHQASQKCLTISADCVKILRILQTKDFIYLAKIKANSSLLKEFNQVILLFYNYILG